MGKAFNPHRSSLTETELITADIPVDNVSFRQVGKYTMKAGVGLALGFGSHSSQQDATGRIFVDLKDSTDAILDGTLRINIIDPQDNHLKTIFETRTDVLRTSKTDRRLQIPLPEMPELIGEDFSLQVSVKADSSVTLSKANSDILVDCTTYSVR